MNATKQIPLPKSLKGWRDVLYQLNEEDRNAFINSLSPKEQENLYNLIHTEQVIGAKKDIYPFIELLTPENKPAAHHKIILDNIMDVVDGDTKRLMIFAPPGSAKSTYASVLFPAYFIGRKKICAMIGASHTEDLAINFSRRCRNVVNTKEYKEIFGFGLSRTHNAAKQWETEVGGEFYAVGIGGAVTGRRADGGLIDDPVKSRKESLSPAYREMVWDWYLSDFRTRLKNQNSFIIIIMTRWHVDDLAGRILGQNYTGESGYYYDIENTERWKVLNLQARCETQNDPLGRKQGEYLWPEWWSPEFFEQAEQMQGSFNWSSLYQGTPIPKEGGMFSRDWFEIVEHPPNQNRNSVRCWDIAATVPTRANSDPDYTAGCLMSVYNGTIYIEDIVRHRETPHKNEMIIRRITHRDGYYTKVRIEQEPGSSGKMNVAYFQRLLSGFNVRGVPSTGNKAQRADPFASMAEAGNVKLVRGKWNKQFLDEIELFPMGSHDDQVDAASGAWDELHGGKRAGTWGRNL